MKNRKIIITGPPGSGKSTIIQALIKKKYTCFKEINPSNIDNKKVRESKQLLSEFIFKKRLEDYHSAKNNLTFFDRSTIDVIAYLNYWKLNHPHEWIKIIKNQNYFINVFYAPFWSEIYATNNYRKENLKEAMLIDKFLRNLFLKFNFNLIELPKTNIENRIEFITNQI